LLAHAIPAFPAVGDYSSTAFCFVEIQELHGHSVLILDKKGTVLFLEKSSGDQILQRP
jgi:hypothetical protein